MSPSSRALLRQADPHLAALKSFALSLMEMGPGPYELGNKLDMSRHRLYEAIRDDDQTAAKAWLNATDLAVAAALVAIPQVKSSATEAVREIRNLLGNPRRLHA